jgi:hypothetical protein
MANPASMWWRLRQGNGNEDEVVALELGCRLELGGKAWRAALDSRLQAHRF